MIDALQVFVRGFEEAERGSAICGYLTANGFEIEIFCDGDSDDLGGLIETNIAQQDNLLQTDPDTILNQLRQFTGFNGLWLQAREFQSADDEEYGRDDEEWDDDDEAEGVVTDEQIKTKLIALAQAGEPAPAPESALGQLLAAYTDPNANISPAKMAKLRAECFPFE